MTDKRSSRGARNLLACVPLETDNRVNKIVSREVNNESTRYRFASGIPGFCPAAGANQISHSGEMDRPSLRPKRQANALGYCQKVEGNHPGGKDRDPAPYYGALQARAQK